MKNKYVNSTLSEVSCLCAVIVLYNYDEKIVRKISNYKTIFDCFLVVSNSPGAACEKYLLSLEDKKMRVIINEKNLGIARALNQGLTFAKHNKYEYLLTLDQDSTITQDNVCKLLSSIVKYKASSVGPNYNNLPLEHDKNVNYLISSGNIVHVKNAMDVGGYTDKLFIDCVDIDFSFKLLSNGYKIIKIKDAFLDHKIGEYEDSSLLKIKYLSHNPKRFYYMYRNNVYIYRFYFKKLPLQSMKLFVSLVVATLKILTIEKSKIEKLKYAFKGFIDGINNNFNNNSINM